MQRTPTKLLVTSGALTLAVAVALPTIAAANPESILPPGFNSPPPPPPAGPTPSAPPTTSPPPSTNLRPTSSAPSTSSTPSKSGSSNSPSTGSSPSQDSDGLLPPEAVITGEEGSPVDVLPTVSDAYVVYQRDSNYVGVLGPENFGLGQEAYGGVNGTFLSELMN